AELFGDGHERIFIGRMQPAAADVEHDIRRGLDRVCPSADAIARFQHDQGEAGIPERIRRAKARGARADDGDVDMGGKGTHGANGELRMANSVSETSPPANAPIRYSLFATRVAYATASRAFSARLRSLASRNFLRRRIDFGVTSTSSSSSI